MKKTIVALAVALQLAAAHAADTKPVSEKVLSAFRKEFVKATDISWTVIKSKDLFQANFTFQGCPVQAVYNEDGELLGTARTIGEQQLPVMVIKSFSTNYNGFTLRQAEEYSVNDEVYYVLNMYNEKETLVVKFYPNGDAQRIKKIKNKS